MKGSISFYGDQLTIYAYKNQESSDAAISGTDAYHIDTLNEESEIQRNIEISSEDKLEELQPVQVVSNGLKQLNL